MVDWHGFWEIKQFPCICWTALYFSQVCSIQPWWTSMHLTPCTVTRVRSRLNHLWMATADSSMWIVCVCISVYLATAGRLCIQHSKGMYDRDLWLGKHTQTHKKRAHAHFLHKCLALGLLGDLGIIQKFVHKAAAAFILLYLSRSS